MDQHDQSVKPLSALPTAYWKTEKQSRRLAKQTGMNLPSWMSCMLHTTLYVIVPFLLFTTLLIAGSILISYSIYLAKPVPAHFVVAISSTFAGLILIGVATHVTILLQEARAVPPSSGKDIESRTGRDPRQAASKNAQRAAPGQIANFNPPPQSFYQAREPTTPTIPPESKQRPRSTIWEHPEQRYPTQPTRTRKDPPAINRESVELPTGPENSYHPYRRGRCPAPLNLTSSFPALRPRQPTPHPSPPISPRTTQPKAPEPVVSPLTPVAAAPVSLDPESLRAGCEGVEGGCGMSALPGPLRITRKAVGIEGDEGGEGGGREWKTASREKLEREVFRVGGRGVL